MHHTILSADEVAALLTERGMTARDGGPVKPDTLRMWLQQGKFPGARCFSGRRGFWAIPRAAVEAFFEARQTP
jgi:hypothetical protein